MLLLLAMANFKFHSSIHYFAVDVDRLHGSRFAVSYSLGQSAPLMAVVWGLIWKEFKGAPGTSVAFLVLTFVLYASAIALVTLSGSDSIHVCRTAPNATNTSSLW